MPTIRKLFLLKLVLAALVTGGALAGLHTLQAKRIPEALRAQSERAKLTENPDAAVRYLRHYLEFRPDDLEAVEELVALLKKRPVAAQNPADQLQLLERVLRGDPSRQAVRRDALELALVLRRYTAATGHATELLQVSPKDAKVWRQLALCQAALQKTDDAKKSYESAITADPAEGQTYQRYAEFLASQAKQPAEAKSVLERLVAALPSSAESYLARARFDSLEGEPGRSIGDVTKALELDPDHPDALLMLADHFQKGRQPGLARECLADGVRLYPGDVRLVRGLAWLDANLGNPVSAAAVLEAGLNRVTDHVELMLPLAELLVQLGDTARFTQVVKRLEPRPGPAAQTQVKYLKARLAMSQGDWPGALGLLTQLRSDAVTMPALEVQTCLLLAVCYQRSADPAREQELLGVVTTKDPNHLAGRLGLAQSLLNSGKPAEALAEYEAAIRSPYATFGAFAGWAKLKARGLRLGGGKAGDFAAVLKTLSDAAPRAGAGSLDPLMAQVDVLSCQGKLDDAARLLKAEAVRRPGEPRLWAALSDVVAKFAGVNAGLAILDEGQVSTGDGVEIRLARADLSGRDPARLRPLAPMLTQMDSWPEGDQIRLISGVIEEADQAGDEAGVLAGYESLVARRPTDIALLSAAGERAARLGKSARVAQLRAELARLDATGDAAVLLDAWQVIASRNSAAAKPAHDALVAKFGAEPNRADACVALAKLKLILGEQPAALALLERAAKLEPARLPPTSAYLGQLALGGADAAVKAVLTRLALDPKWSGEPFRRAVAGAVAQAPLAAPELLKAAKPYLQLEPGGLGWLAEQYAALTLSQDAINTAHDAVSARGATPDDELRFAYLVGRLKSKDDGAKAMLAAKTRLTPPLFASTAASFADSAAAPANFTANAATPEEARMYAQSRLAVKLSRYRRGEGIDVLESFLATNPAAGDAAWARRNLAMLLVARSKPGDRKRGMELLTAPTAGTEGLDEKRETANVLAVVSQHLDGSDRVRVMQASIRTLEGLVQETKVPRDAYLLAQVYRAAGQREACLQVLNQLLDADPRSLEYHVMAMEEFCESGRVAEGEGCATRLMTLYPADFRAIRAVARFECRAGRPERAQALAESYLRTAEPAAGDLPAKSARVAELLDELARKPGVAGTKAAQAMADSAIRRYEDLIPARPDTLAAAAGMLGAVGRHAEAFKLVEKYAALPPRVHANAGLAALRSPGATPEQFDRVAKALADAIAAEPQSTGLMLNLGEFNTLRQDTAAAGRAYEAVLARDAHNVVALNNLAWLLSAGPETAERAAEYVRRAVAEIGLTGELLDTRARIEISAGRYDLAEKDLREALAQEKTALRYFHLALARPGKPEALVAFRQAKERGLDPKAVHPADAARYRALEELSRAEEGKTEAKAR